MKKIKGSITIFAVLSIMLVAAILFTLLEAARRQEIMRIARIQTKSLVESAFAGYVRPLWEEYHLLALEMGDEENKLTLEKEMQALSDQNLDLLQIRAIQAELVEYLLLTDEDAFETAVASYMTNNIVAEAAKRLYGQYEAIGEVAGDKLEVDDAIGEAYEALESGRITVDEQNAEGTYEIPEDLPKVEVKENPLDVVTVLREKGILALAVPSQLPISSYCSTNELKVSKRTLLKGNMENEVDPAWLDKIYLEQYLSEYLGCFTRRMPNRAYQYEQEYLIGGKQSDEENLKVVVNRLLAIRESANLLYLATDQVKQKEVEAVALAIAGASVNPVVIEIVKWGILAAWAYVESILDVRALLSGYRISPIKSSREWTSDVTNLGALITNSGRAIDCKAGSRYEDYLGILMFAEHAKELSLRAMDVMEECVRQRSGYENLQMDQLIIEGGFQIQYAYRTIFMGMDPITASKSRDFYIENYGSYSYRKAGV